MSKIFCSLVLKAALVAAVLVWLPATGLAQYTPNLGPNQQVQQPPLNPTVQSIHPR